MTHPALTDDKPKRRHRPRTGMGVYVTDQELIEYLGVPAKTAREAIQEFEKHATFQKSKEYGGTGATSRRLKHGWRATMGLKCLLIQRED